MFIARHRGWGCAPPTGSSHRVDAGSRSLSRPSRRATTWRRRKPAAVVLALAGLALLLAGCGGTSDPVKATSASSRFDGIPADGFNAPNFALHDQHGQLISLSAERGKYVIVTFLYVHCKNVCPIIAGQLNQVLTDLPPAARDQVRVLAVSVDPKGDTHAAVAKFIAEHKLLPQFLYLTGTAKTLSPVWKGYHVASVQTGGGVVVGHTAFELLLNRSGTPEAIYDSTNTPQQVLHDLRVLGLKA